MKYFLLALLSLNAYAAAELSPDVISNPPEKMDFFNANRGKSLVNNPDALVGPKKALVAAGECVKYLKNGESYWNKYETEVAKVEAIGSKSLKLRPIYFLKVGLNDWTYSETAKDLPFENQLQYETTECPKDKDQIPEEVAEALRKKQ